jgi:hypothetical protein
MINQENLPMKFAFSTLLVVGLFCSLTGCGKKEVAPTAEPIKRRPAVSLERQEIREIMPGSDHASVFFLSHKLTSDVKPVFIVWTDARSYSGGTGYPNPENNPPRTNIVGGDYVIRFGGTGDDFDRTVELEFEIQELKKGNVLIEGKSYDLADGSLVLVSGDGDDLRVKQLRRDVSTLRPEPNELIAFGKATPEIKAFFSNTAQSTK